MPKNKTTIRKAWIKIPLLVLLILTTSVLLYFYAKNEQMEGFALNEQWAQEWLKPEGK